nr:MAG TPA: hypothetical protein [Caudoviricetes sp.]
MSKRYRGNSFVWLREAENKRFSFQESFPAVPATQSGIGPL